MSGLTESQQVPVPEQVPPPQGKSPTTVFVALNVVAPDASATRRRNFIVWS